MCDLCEKGYGVEIVENKFGFKNEGMWSVDMRVLAVEMENDEIRKVSVEKRRDKWVMSLWKRKDGVLYVTEEVITATEI